MPGLAHWPEDVPVLTDGVVTLRAHDEGDLDPMVEMCLDAGTRRWTDLPSPYDRTQAELFLADRVAPAWRTGSGFGWAIDAPDEARADRRYAGNIDIRRPPAADIGFCLHPWARGRGIMARATRLALTWAFDHGGVDSVLWTARLGNLTSRRVAWATGFTFHGILPRRLGKHAPLVDAWVATITRGEPMTPRTRWWGTPTSAGKRVTLRPFTDADLPRIVEACSDERSQHWLIGLPRDYSEDSARTYLGGLPVAASRGAAITWCISDPETDRLLGAIAVFDLDDEDPTSGEIGYWAHPDARGRGAMSEALALVIAHAMAPADGGGMGLRRLELLAAGGNSASQHVARSNGFVEVGRKRAAEPLGDGSYDDLVFFDLLAEEHSATR